MDHAAVVAVVDQIGTPDDGRVVEVVEVVEE